MKERSGPVKTQVVPDAKRVTIEPIILENIRQGSKVHTDEWWAYRRLEKHGFKHESVNHGSKQWVSGGSHTNSIEGYWSLIKRSIRGTHVHVSRQHMPKYLAELISDTICGLCLTRCFIFWCRCSGFASPLK